MPDSTHPAPPATPPTVEEIQDALENKGEFFHKGIWFTWNEGADFIYGWREGAGETEQPITPCFGEDSDEAAPAIHEWLSNRTVAPPATEVDLDGIRAVLSGMDEQSVGKKAAPLLSICAALLSLVERQQAVVEAARALRKAIGPIGKHQVRADLIHALDDALDTASRITSLPKTSLGESET